MTELIRATPRKSAFAALGFKAAIAERIALTHGFRTSSDKAVLIGLASFAHFETGAGARPSVDTLQRT